APASPAGPGRDRPGGRVGAAPPGAVPPCAGARPRPHPARSGAVRRQPQRRLLHRGHLPVRRRGVPCPRPRRHALGADPRPRHRPARSLAVSPRSGQRRPRHRRRPARARRQGPRVPRRRRRRRPPLDRPQHGDLRRTYRLRPPRRRLRGAGRTRCRGGRAQHRRRAPRRCRRGAPAADPPVAAARAVAADAQPALGADVPARRAVPAAAGAHHHRRRPTAALPPQRPRGRRRRRLRPRLRGRGGGRRAKAARRPGRRPV
ncbi:MAG: hypothetical protein AVDCRST_MAG41-3649, partial [uncultured Corynebacteriales bacterium]